MTRITILILFLFSLQHSSFTQEILDTVPHLNLNQIRVSGTTQKKQEYSPLLIELKSFSDLQSIPKINIGEALSSIPGVYAATSGPAVFKPVVRGMQGNRVVTVWNGLRMEGQQWGVDHGLGLTDVGLGSVEIIKGPASFIYGSDALGGVIYFRDEDSPAKGNFKLNFGEKYNSNTQGVVQQVFYAQSSKKLSWHIGGQYGNHADIKLPNGNYFYNSRFSEIGVK
ncbi:MAG: TonB-dependent receptor plug domain-containing protein, partial [Bacteroidota bacterium]